MTLNLQDDDVQLVLNILAQRPYAEVAKVINDIARQMKEQTPVAEHAGNGKPLTQ